MDLPLLEVRQPDIILTVLATVEIDDGLEAISDLGVPNAALVEYKAPETYEAEECPSIAPPDSAAAPRLAGAADP